jgi:hypothetical protein
VPPRALAAVPDLERELDDLYGGPLELFTSARNDLARRLRKAGQSEAAERIRALKKPSVPVWTVNQLARRHRKEVDALLAAGERMRRAQEKVFGGSGAEVLREATAAEREAIRRLTQRAQAVLREEGRSASHAVLERIASTLRAAAVDVDAARHLAVGRLSGELDAPGFAAVAELAPPPRATKRRSDATAAVQTRRREAERRTLQSRVDRLERTLAEHEERARRAEETAAELRTRVERARAELDAAQRELDELA